MHVCALTKGKVIQLIHTLDEAKQNSGQIVHGLPSDTTTMMPLGPLDQCSNQYRNISRKFLAKPSGPKCQCELLLIIGQGPCLLITFFFSPKKNNNNKKHGTGAGRRYTRWIHRLPSSSRTWSPMCSEWGGAVCSEGGRNFRVTHKALILLHWSQPCTRQLQGTFGNCICTQEISGDYSQSVSYSDALRITYFNTSVWKKWCIGYTRDLC